MTLKTRDPVPGQWEVQEASGRRGQQVQRTAAAEGRGPGARAPSGDVAQDPEGLSEPELWRWPTASGARGAPP